MSYTCSICGEESTRICVRCTKDACPNHVCEKCQRCSDCCECEIAAVEPVRGFMRAAIAPHPAVAEPEPEPGPPPAPETEHAGAREPEPNS